MRAQPNVSGVNSRLRRVRKKCKLSHNNREETRKFPVAFKSRTLSNPMSFTAEFSLS